MYATPASEIAAGVARRADLGADRPSAA